MADTILQNGNLINSFFPQCVLSGSITAVGVLKGSLSIPNSYDDYIGQYEVTPKTKPQTLKTKDLHMTDDVRIKEIPTYEVSNQTGTTFYIGE